MTTLSVGSYLLKCLREAREMKHKQQQRFEEHSENFPDDVIKKWEDMVTQWESDFSKPDPYEEPRASKWPECYRSMTLTMRSQKSA